MAQPAPPPPPNAPPYPPTQPAFGAPGAQPAYPAPPYYAPPPAPPKKSRKMLWIGLGVGVVLAIIVIAVLASLASVGSSIDVTAINVTSSDNACNADGHSFSGFITGSGGGVQYTLTIRNTNLIETCAVATVSTTTSGFSLTGANTPVSIPAGGTEAVSFTIHAPSGSYNGVLTLDLE